jgi:hypothetical protein
MGGFYAWRSPRHEPPEPLRRIFGTLRRCGDHKLIEADLANVEKQMNALGAPGRRDGFHSCHGEKRMGRPRIQGETNGEIEIRDVGY